MKIWYEDVIVSVDFIDIVKDPISSGDYLREEDPKLYVSDVTGRGPLTDNWRQEYARAGAQHLATCVLTFWPFGYIEIRRK